MNTKGQLLLVSGLLMSITLIAVSSTITHSVNLGAHQGERHDLTPLISGIESNFPLALEYQVDQDDGDVTLSETFDNVSEDFESLFAPIAETWIYFFTLCFSHNLEIISGISE